MTASHSPEPESDYEYPVSVISEDEDAPLLLSTQAPHAVRSPSAYQAMPHPIITAMIISIIFILAFGGYLMAVSSLRLFEDVICHHYYDRLGGEGHIGLDGNIDESMCKGEEVQKELNILLAGLKFIGTIPPLLVTIPYGLLADRIGRKPIFILSLCGLILGGCWDIIVLRFWKVLPIRLIWISPIFTFIGGGEAVAGMMFYAIGCDVTTEAHRLNVFLIGASAGLIANILAPPLTGYLMSISPWVSLLSGLFILVLGTAIILFVPETLHLRTDHAASAPLITDIDPDQSGTTAKPNNSNFFNAVKSHVREGLERLRTATSVLNSLPILLLLSTFMVQPFSKQAMDLSLRYVSNRFHYPLRQTTILSSFCAVINIILLLAILPFLSYFLRQHLHFTPKRTDLFLARWSILILVLGALIIGLSPTIALTAIGMGVWTLGTGTVSLTRALITTQIDQEHIGQLYAAIALVEIVGNLAAGPMIAALYTLGLKMKGSWVGLPFVCLAVTCAFCAVGIWGFGYLAGKDLDRVVDAEAEEDAVRLTTDVLIDV